MLNPSTTPPLARTFRLGERVRSVAAYAAENKGQERPLLCLVGGGFLILVSAALIAFITYHAVYLHKSGESGTFFWLGMAFFPYTVGAFVFSLGYELNDTGRALRLTLVILVTSVVFVGIACVALILLTRADAASSAFSGNRGRSAFGLIAGIGEEDSPQGEGDASTDMFTVTCDRCGERFMPLPPQATCPSCGWQAVTVA
jgi:hypothetical protein